MHRPFFVVLLALLHHETGYAATAASGGCERRCGGAASVPYPFGFSPGCPIALPCDANTSTPFLPSRGGDNNNDTSYRVISFNSTSSAVLIALPPSCSRSVQDASRALYGWNYGLSSRTGLFLRGDCRETNASVCSVPVGVMTGLLRTAHCENGNASAAGGAVACVASTSTNAATPGMFLRWAEAEKTSCHGVLTSAAFVNTADGTVTLEFGVAELRWWLNGTCAGGHEPCAAKATCSDVTTPRKESGHQCACVAGMDGDGFLAGDGCYYYSGDGYSKNRRKIYTIAGSSSILVCLLLFSFWLGYNKFKSKRESKETERIESFLQKNGTIHPKRYSYTQVKRMTKSFAEKLGQGGYGAVYRGDISDGRQIAVKMLKDYKTDGEDFINEVASISKTSHVNVVTLLGFCLEGSKRALIYDYMPNGSLEKYALKDNGKGEITLGWEKLFDIAVGIARGLEYLHRGCNTRIVHFDIKPHNILLDQDFCPKISDFGLAKLCLDKESIISIGGARGTIGYIAPEVYSKQFGAVSSKSDVYSYGMMVLEMVGARDKRINANSGSSSQYFPQWIYEHLDEYCVSASEIHGEVTEVIRKMIVVGLWCIQISATDRPTMTRVVEMLEGSTCDLNLPPNRS